MEKKLPFRFTLLAHVIGWAVFFFAPLLFSPGPGIAAYFTERDVILSLIFRNLLLVALFYTNLLYVTPVLLTKRLPYYFLILFLLILVVSAANYWIHELLTGPGRSLRPRIHRFSHVRYGRPRIPMMLAGPFFSGFLVTTIVAATSTLIVMWKNWVQTQAKEQERTLQKVAAELSALKLQISPHFLFNTLNNIRWLVRSKSDQAETAVVKLSQLLRYILYQTNEDTVPLFREVDHLKDFISLQRMRLRNDDAVKVSIAGMVGGQQIVPLLFIPLVENFFKYGDFEGTYENHISLVIEGNHLKFSTENRVATNTAEDREASGIGLENVKRRLALHYPGKHTLKYGEHDRLYKLEMNIVLA